jgi:hypothetical protein
MLFALLSPETRSNVVGIIKGPYPDGRDSAWHTPAGEELIRATTDHFIIAIPLSKCFKGVDLSLNGSDQIAGQVSLAFLLGLQPNGEQSWGTSPSSAPDIQLNNYQRTILYISQSISRARGELASSAAQNQSSMISYQFLIIILGAMTTILVSIKSMSQGNTKPYFVIGILAVVFSASGTAMSSINSFVGPSEAYVRSERALLQLRQLHMDLELLIAEDKNVCKEFDAESLNDTRAKKIADIAGRLKEIVGQTGIASNASSSGTTPPGQSSASGGSAVR